MPAAGYISIMTGTGLIATTLVVAALVVTNPVAIGPIGVTLWFVALLAGLSCWIGLAILYATGLIQGDTPLVKRLFPAWRGGLFLGLWLTTLLALGSLKQLTLRDTLLTGLFLAIIEFYFRMRA